MSNPIYMTDVQLISAITGRSENVSMNLVNQFKDLSEMSDMITLANVKGISDATISKLECVFELGRRIESVKAKLRLKSDKITCSEDIFYQMNHTLSDIDHEELWAIYCSKSGKILKKVMVSKGGRSSTISDTPLIVKQAILCAASFVCMVHNHIHSTTRPSTADLKMTIALKEALNMFDIRLMDHVIISDDCYHSMHDNNEL